MRVECHPVSTCNMTANTHVDAATWLRAELPCLVAASPLEADLNLFQYIITMM